MIEVAVEHLKNAEALLVLLGNGEEAKVEIEMAEAIGIEEQDESYYYRICHLYDDIVNEPKKIQEVENEAV
jgi:hypothetical protein